METLKIDISKVFGFVPREEIYKLESKVKDAAAALENKTGKGSDFLGWVNLPSSISESHIKDIEQVAARMQKEVDAVVVIGIGGSYLGTRAVSEALSHSFLHLKKDRKYPIILYAGQNIGEDYLNELVEVLDTLRYGIVVISKSGTTTEPALAFRLLKGSFQKAHHCCYGCP
jgi:glucose-6-phosphate isomerase